MIYTKNNNNFKNECRGEKFFLNECLTFRVKFFYENQRFGCNFLAFLHPV